MTFSPLEFERLSEEAMLASAQKLADSLSMRRTVRDFSPEQIPMEVVKEAIRAAATAPNGANLQPWHFVIVTDTDKKRALREAAEAEERAFYEQRASEEWLEALEPLGTDANKAFLEEAPVLIGIFSERFQLDEMGEKRKVYYPTESVGIATGMLITALHMAGLATLTHTPSPMGFMNEVMERPKHERPFLLLVVGYPAENAVVPDITKKEFEKICTEY